MLVFNETMEVVCIVTIEDLSAAVGAIITLLVIVYKIVLEIFNTASEKRDLSNALTNALNILKMYLNSTPLVENWTAVALFFLSAIESGAEEKLDSEVLPCELATLLAVGFVETEPPCDVATLLLVCWVEAAPVVKVDIILVVEAKRELAAFLLVALFVLDGASVSVVVVAMVVVVTVVVGAKVVGAFSGFALIALIALLTPSMASRFSTSRVFLSCKERFDSSEA